MIEKSGKLYGVGVGPGDPELMTIKAKNILEKVDIIYTPISRKNKESKALKIAEKIVNCKEKVQKLLFPMTKNKDEKEKHWQNNAQKIITDLKNKKAVAFITIGDPLLYSTYIYILNHLKKGEFKGDFTDINSLIETVPGVTSINTSSARLNLPLAAGDEKLLVLPDIPNNKNLGNLIKDFDNVVILKVSKNIEKIMDFLEEFNYDNKFAFISRCGYQEEFITTDVEELKHRDIDYLSLIIFKKDVELQINH